MIKTRRKIDREDNGLPDLFVMPDPDADKPKEEKLRDKIEARCGKCHTLCTIAVKDADLLNDHVRQELFVTRGASYNPPLCTFCKQDRKH